MHPPVNGVALIVASVPVTPPTKSIISLADPEAGSLLNRLADLPATRGSRQQLHWHENPQYRFAPRPDVMKDADWRRAVAARRSRAAVRTADFCQPVLEGAELARAFPDTVFVLEHAGMQEDMSPEGWQAWCDGMAALSQCRNVHAKHSGPGTFVHACRDDVIEPIVKETVALFGAGRCFFGSNFPIEKLWTDCGTLYRTFRGAIAQLDEAGQAAIPHDTAARLYRIRSTCASRGLVIASNVANDAVIPGWCVSTIPE